jgi:hypothetical protein
MQATRVRFHLGPAIEWVVAAVFLLCTLSVASLIVRELRTAPPATQPAVTAAPATALPVAVPARAVSVPSLLLQDGRQIRVGDTLAHVNGIAPWRAAPGRETVDQGALGERLTRAYDYQGTSFVVVFEPFERAGVPRVAAIYLP